MAVRAFRVRLRRAGRCSDAARSSTRAPKCGSRTVVIRASVDGVDIEPQSRANRVDAGTGVFEHRLERGPVASRTSPIHPLWVGLLLCRSDVDVIDAELARELRRGLGISSPRRSVGFPRSLRYSREYSSVRSAAPRPFGVRQTSATGSRSRGRGRSDRSARSRWRGVSLRIHRYVFLLVGRERDGPAKAWTHGAIADVLRVVSVDKRGRQADRDAAPARSQRRAARRRHSGIAIVAQRRLLRGSAAPVATTGPPGILVAPTPRLTSGRSRTPAGQVQCPQQPATLVAAVATAATGPIRRARAADRATSSAWPPACSARNRPTPYSTTPAAPSTMSLAMHQPTAAPTQPRPQWRGAARSCSSRANRVGNHYRTINERKQPADERIERRRQREGEAREHDGADGGGHAGGAGDRHRQQPEGSRHRVLRVVRHRPDEASRREAR